MDRPGASIKSSLQRYPSQNLLMPRRERAKPIFYGVDSFWPTLIDFYSVDDDTRVLWSSRAHRKTFHTLHLAFSSDSTWCIISWSIWSACFSAFGAALFLYGSYNEIAFDTAATATDGDPNETPVPLELLHRWIDLPYFLGAASFFVAQLLTYLEVINCCHDLERWLHEYVHADPPIRKMKWLGFSPFRIDYWSALLHVLGWFLLLCARGYVYHAKMVVYGVVHLSRGDPRIFWGHWIPSLLGFFSLSVGAYLAHVEVIHRWFVCRLHKLEFWVTGTNCVSVGFLFMCSVGQFIDPFNLVFSDAGSMLMFQIGAALALLSAVLMLVEVYRLHMPAKHPVYGKLATPSTTTVYGTV
ncbi:hypothetical protein H257_06479 [Aphanomyces astaci]|uniref:Uncharacterized protein n=1 Tax=Aphanomyces astaci TaxID=112090 RepID=W4GKA5_APHAT|nr:hypothetical protein H257_06479 [Aphanomyces astaci]ETV80082.1 hypothetical protein H257_06479 [Aphanomyces astaci]RQM20989.1 hypothetical protein B5M09_009892 [Aphanomyces astaci]|eukprot:XP_009830006.1 hypothetical protein H257_06479 [Aphanomyces astaci]